MAATRCHPRMPMVGEGAQLPMLGPAVQAVEVARTAVLAAVEAAAQVAAQA